MLTITPYNITTTCMQMIFFFNDTASTKIYTLSLHDALPIYWVFSLPKDQVSLFLRNLWSTDGSRSEEHTSELQSHVNLVCRLLLEKKKNRNFGDANTSILQNPHNMYTNDATFNATLIVETNN